MRTDSAIDKFWQECRAHLPALPAKTPEAWAFGATPEHARAEGEGDRTLAAWRDIHERFWRDHSEDPRGFDPQMPVVCETFRVLYPVG